MNQLKNDENLFSDEKIFNFHSSFDRWGQLGHETFIELLLKDFLEKSQIKFKKIEPNF